MKAQNGNDMYRKRKQQLTIAKVQDVFANRYMLGITVADARNVAKELFDIANEKNEAITRTGKYENDAVFAPKALRWLDEEEKGILDNLTKNASETDVDTVYTGGNPDLAARAARRANYADQDQDQGMIKMGFDVYSLLD